MLCYPRSNMHPRVILSVSNFFFSLSTALSVYIIIPYLSQFVGEAVAGLVVTLGGIFSLILFLYLPRLIEHYGAQEIALVATLVQSFALLSLAAVPGGFIAVVGIAIMLALQPVIAYQFDLLLEATVTETTTIGRVRTVFLTAYNLGVCLAPLLLGALLDSTNAYLRIFLACAGLMVPFVVLLTAHGLPKGIPPHASHLRESLVRILHDRDLTGITFAHFALYLFSIWAPLYAPAFLHNVIGIPWGTLGWLFAIMLIPYVVVEYPAGWLADRMRGEKKPLIIGFVLAGTALAALSILTPASSLFLIGTILVVSRIGAALIESMTEGHFFRRIKNDDVGSMSFFRGVWPLANVVGPIIGSCILAVGSYEAFFLITGALIIFAGVLTAFLTNDSI